MFTEEKENGGKKKVPLNKTFSRVSKDNEVVRKLKEWMDKKNYGVLFYKYAYFRTVVAASVITEL